MPMPVLPGQALAAEVELTFLDAYDTTAAAQDPLLSNIMDRFSSNKRQEKYFYWNSTPHPERWDRGENVPTEPFDGNSFTVVNEKWGKMIQWFLEDREDDMTASIPDRAKDLGENFAMLDSRVAFQIINGTVDPLLLKKIPDAPDGVGPFSAVDGSGADRFGAVGGNIVAGVGVASSEAIRDGVFKALGRTRRYQGTKGQPLFPSSMADRGLTIIYPSEHEGVFRKAFEQSRTSDGSTSVDNSLQQAGLTFNLWSTPRLTGTTWYIGYNQVGHKALFTQEREGITFREQTGTNSDEGRIADVEGTLVRKRAGYGVWLPWALQQVTA